MKKVIRGKPIDYEKAFSAEEVLKQLNRDRERLIKEWGQEQYDLRKKQIEDYICTKTAKG